VTRTPNGTLNCPITADQHGNKRIFYISCYDHISRGTQNKNLLWIHLPKFDRHANRIDNELNVHTKGKFGLKPRRQMKTVFCTQSSLTDLHKDSITQEENGSTHINKSTTNSPP
jgi:hypothetical protein